MHINLSVEAFGLDFFHDILISVIQRKHQALEYSFPDCEFEFVSFLHDFHFEVRDGIIDDMIVMRTLSLRIDFTPKQDLISLK